MLLWPRLLTPEKTIEADEVNQLVDSLSSAIALSADLTKPVGVYADQNLSGVLLIFSLIKLGAKVAICPLRDSPQALNDWLKEVGVGILASSKPHDIPWPGAQFLVDDWIATPANRHSQNSPHFATILKTSGTSAKPKSAVISLDAHLASARSVSDFLGFSRGKVWGLNLPLYHVSGLGILFRALVSGGDIFIIDKRALDYSTHLVSPLGLTAGSGAAESAESLAALIRGVISHISLVPTQLKQYIKSGIDLSSLDAVFLGGDFLDKPTKESALKSGIRLFESYGMTESASAVYIRSHFSNDYAVLPHARIKIGADQEIWVSGASMFSGYLGSQPFGEGEFFPTGDLGQFDLGALQLIGRKSSRIISGGENIQCEEIETYLKSLSDVLDAVVVGVADEQFGERPAAFIKLSIGKFTDAVAVRLSQNISDRLGSVKTPKFFFSWPDDAPAQKSPRAWLKERARVLLNGVVA